jgi:hypothetical protein
MTDEEIEAFTNAISDLGRRTSEFLATGDDTLTADDIETAVEELPKPDPLDDRPVNE